MLPKYKYVVLPAAVKDFETAICWYKAVNPKLPQSFRASFRVGAEKIKAFPFSCAIRYADIRIRKMTGFPNVIHYWIEEDSAIASSQAFTTKAVILKKNGLTVLKA